MSKPWYAADLAQLAELSEADAGLPGTAPRALLAVRLSVLTADTTSPVRQELDLRALALDRGYRVVGVASDLNVSATTVPPWRRKQLGHWLTERAPEFDVLLFWKLDRFVRRLSDLSVMIDWSRRFGKNLVSKHDPIDLSTAAGESVAMAIGGIAEIEAATTGLRVASLWEYSRTQSAWLVGKPAYGYTVTEAGLAVDPDASRVIRWCMRAALRGVSTRRMVTVLVRAGVPTGGGGQWTTATLLRRLRNPALLGYRVSADTESSSRRSKPVMDRNGQPIRVAEPVFTENEWEALQAALDRRARRQPQRSRGGATRFLGILVCAACGTNMTVQKTRATTRDYTYLRCRRCPGGGQGAPDPEQVYDRLIRDVLSLLGNEPVRIRKYVRVRNAHWALIDSGRTFRQRWEQGGHDVMAEDLRRAGVVCRVTRVRVPGVRAPEVALTLTIPPNAVDRLVVKRDEFGG